MKHAQAGRQGQYTLYEYKPTIWRPLLFNFEPMRFARRVRYLLEYLHPGHYQVFYLLNSNDFVGFCVVARGGRRLPCTTRQDIVLGPYYVDKNLRGQGYSKIMISMVLEYYDQPYKCAYDWIGKSNVPSIRASEACGFHRCGELNIIGIMRRLVLVSEGGSHYVYRHENPDSSEVL